MIPSGTKRLVIPVALPIRGARPSPAFAGAEVQRKRTSKRNVTAHPACEDCPHRTDSSNMLVGLMPNALLIMSFKSIPLVLTSFATTCKHQQWKTQTYTQEITKPPPLIGGGYHECHCYPRHHKLHPGYHKRPRCNQTPTTAPHHELGATCNNDRHS